MVYTKLDLPWTSVWPNGSVWTELLVKHTYIGMLLNYRSARPETSIISFALMQMKRAQAITGEDSEDTVIILTSRRHSKGT